MYAETPLFELSETVFGIWNSSLVTKYNGGG